jgi:hypothetical protein
MKSASKVCFDFRHAGLPAASGNASPDPFRTTVTGANAPAVAKSSAGLVLATSTDDEAQLSELNQDDKLVYDIDEINRVKFLYRVDSLTGDFSDISIALGLISARNATIDSITEAALLRTVGGTALYLETDDGTNNNDDVSAAQTLDDGVWKMFCIDFATDFKTVASPGRSVGRKSSVMFRNSGNGTDAEQSLRRIGEGTQFDMSNYSGGLQLFARIEKASGTDEASLSIRKIEIELLDN